MSRLFSRIFLLASTLGYVILASWVYISRVPTGNEQQLTQLESSLRLAPNHPVIWEHIGRAYLMDPTRSNPEAAVTAFLHAARGNPMEPEVWTDLADAYLQ